MTSTPITNISQLASADPFNEPCGAFKDGKLIKAWKAWPWGYDIVDLDYDFLRPLSPTEVKLWTGEGA